METLQLKYLHIIYVPIIGKLGNDTSKCFGMYGSYLAESKTKPLPFLNDIGKLLVRNIQISYYCFQCIEIGGNRVFSGGGLAGLYPRNSRKQVSGWE